MRRAFLIAGLMALSACATTGVKSLAQGLYAAQGTYKAALVTATVYAQSPTADPAWVRAADRANQTPAMKGARTFMRAYEQCQAKALPGVTIRDESSGTALPCTSFDFSAASIASATLTFRDVLVALRRQ